MCEQMIAGRAKITEISLARTNESAPKRVLAVDYGRKRIGIAISDELRLTARPLATIRRINRQADIRRLREICREHGVAKIVVGHPVHMSGKASPMADEAARFAARLRKELHMPVDLQDERLTSWEAAEMMKQMAGETSTSFKRASRPLDDMAAAILLREYLDRNRDAANAGVQKD